MERAARIDYNVIARLVPEGKGVLDLGCGDGFLLEKLQNEKNVKGKGIEISEVGVKQCIRRGLTVLQGDIDDGLTDYPDKSFDIVILNQTLQVVKKPDLVLFEMLRVGQKGIVGLPNFGYWKLRVSLLLKGRMPKTKVLPYEWYNTPNIHLCTIKDFNAFCKENGIKIEKRIFLSTERGGRIFRGSAPNLFAENAIFIISR
jgi:methionine biosynthesis protein MetW